MDGVRQVDAKLVQLARQIKAPIVTNDYNLNRVAGLQGVQVLITGGMGEGLTRRLAGMGIEGLVTPETDPDLAVAAWLAGTLPLGRPEAHGGHDHSHGHDHA